MDTTLPTASPLLPIGLPAAVLFGPGSLFASKSGLDDDLDGDDEDWEDDDEEEEWEEDEDDEEWEEDEDWDDDDELELESRFLSKFREPDDEPVIRRPSEGPVPKKATKPGRHRPTLRTREEPPDLDDDLP